MSHYKPYPVYKDSGVEWLEWVPEHWEVKRLQYLCSNIKAGPFGSALTKNMYKSEGFRIYGQEQVIPGDFSIGDYYISSELYSELSQYEVRAEDILISCVGTFGKPRSGRQQENSCPRLGSAAPTGAPVRVEGWFQGRREESSIAVRSRRTCP